MKNVIKTGALILAMAISSFAGVTINTPQNGAVTNSPLHVVGNATPDTSAPIIAMQIYIDGNLVQQSNTSGIDKYIPVSNGKHHVAVKSWDAAGRNVLQTVDVTATGSGVTVASPAPGAVLGTSVQFTATAASNLPIVAMHIYDNGQLVFKNTANQINNVLNMTPGSHYVTVQAWDTSGAVFLTPLSFTVAGATPTVDQTPTSQARSNTVTETPNPNATSNNYAPQANIPGNAISFRDVDHMQGWESCDVCAGINAAGPVNPYSMTQNLANPSLDGKAAAFFLGGHTPWGAALWWKQLGQQPQASHFVYDLYFYINNPHISQALEFDINQSVNGYKYIFGTECDIRTNEGWRVWDTQHVRWVATGASCTVNANSWNHLTWEVERVGNQTHFIAVTLNGYRQVIDKYYYAMPMNAKELNVAFQMDGNEYQDNYTVWLDKVNLYAW